MSAQSITRLTRLAAGFIVAALALAPPARAADPGTLLGAAERFAVLASKSVVNTGTSVVTGNLGISPNALVVGPRPQIVDGTFYAGDDVAAQAHADLASAFASAARRPCSLDLTGRGLDGLTLGPGVKCFLSDTRVDGTLTLDAGGDPNAVFIFKVAGTASLASSLRVNFRNGAQACNLYWQVDGATVVEPGAAISGNILARESVGLGRGVSLDGRAQSVRGSVALDNGQVKLPACLVAPTATPTPSNTPPPPTLTPTSLPTATRVSATAQAAGGNAVAQTTPTAATGADSTQTSAPAEGASTPLVPGSAPDTGGLPYVGWGGLAAIALAGLAVLGAAAAGLRRLIARRNQR